MEKIPFTPQGLDVIKEELAYLKGTERQAVINAIAVAREHGDLSENAEYHAAREKQSFIEGRISELEDVTSLDTSHDVNRGATEGARLARAHLAKEQLAFASALAGALRIK